MTNYTRTLLLLTYLFLSGCQTGVNKPNTNNPTALRIHKKLVSYQSLKSSSWPTISLMQPLKPKADNQAVPQIRNRLIKLGDLEPSFASDSTYFDQHLAQAVRLFQWRHGLKADGTIGESTLAAINVSPKTKLTQLKKSMHQFAEFPSEVGARYIHVNVPSFQLDLIEDNKKVINMKIVAGKPSRPTPELYSKVQTIVLNPHWNIPRKIMQRDIIPKIADDPNYLVENNIEIYDSWEKKADTIDPTLINWQKAQESNFPYRMSQLPGDLNALGRVKFVFLNDQDVYLHDTPQKGLFAKIQRAFSSGCVRLEKPFELVEYFIEASDTLNYEEVSEKLLSGKTQYVKIKNPIPIYITYIRAWVDKNGYSHFREDIYKSKNPNQHGKESSES